MTLPTQVNGASWHRELHRRKYTQVVHRRSTRLRVRPGMVLLYMALLTLGALHLFGPTHWRAISASLLPLAALAVYYHRRPYSRPHDGCGGFRW